ncbi:MAG: four helix bundle protein [candidate division Zixibacteria bacterium]|nr:four helix bundle protein [candidate division Zixibacteria bacterium]
MKSYKDLLVWQKAIELIKEVYPVVNRFPREETYVLGDQLRRAAISIPSNIAEGQARQHTAEFKQFLYISLGSLAELNTQLVIAKELGYINEGALNGIERKVVELRKMISTLIAKLPAQH